VIVINFTEEMIKIIKNTYPKYGLNETIQKLGLSKNEKRAVLSMAQKLKLKRIGKYFTQEEIQYLKNNYAQKTVGDIAEKLHKNKATIIYKACKLGLNNDVYYFSKDDINYIKNNYGEFSIKDISEHLNKSYDSVVTKANKLGLCKKEKWTEEEIEILKQVYPNYTNKKISKDFLLNRNPTSIATMAHKFNLIKSKEKNVKWYNKDDMIKNLKEISEKIKRTPYEYELVKLGLPSGKTFDRYCGSYRQACIDAKIIPNYNLFGISIHCKSKDGTNCASKSEQIICDYLTDHNIKYIKEPYYKDYIDDNRCKQKRFDWKVGKYFIEFFGMPEKSYYRDRMKEKIKICKDNNIKLISLYRSDLKNLNKKLHILLQQNP